MHVNPNSGPECAPDVPSRQRALCRRPGQCKPLFDLATSLDTAVEQTPALRADRVNCARKLVRDNSYPSEELINKLSALLAIHIGSNDTSE
jgi:hypothetical protein